MEVDIKRAIRFAGAVSPKATGRQVVLETSTDGSTWTPTQATATTSANGAFTIAAANVGSGSVSVRASVAETADSAAAVSRTVGVYFAEYKAAGVKYLSCVGPGNRRVDKLNRATASYNSGSTSLKSLQSALLRYDSAQRVEDACLQNYDWPPSVSKLVEDLVASNGVMIDGDNQAARAHDETGYADSRNTSEYNHAASSASADAAKIRQRLGLPARR